MNRYGVIAAIDSARSHLGNNRAVCLLPKVSRLVGKAHRSGWCDDRRVWRRRSEGARSTASGSRFNQTFRWVDITRVCFKDQGMYGSDFLYIELRGCEKPAIIVTAAKGGPEFFGKLCEEFLPGKVWRSATGETRGSLHCWPPKTADKRL